MRIVDAIPVLRAQMVFKKTPKGRSITEEGVKAIAASLEDEKNFGVDVVKCLNCGIIMSSLLVPNGCVNCGSKDLDKDVKSVEQKEIEKEIEKDEY